MCFIYLYFFIHQVCVNNKSVHRWGSSRHLNRPYAKGELLLQSLVLSRLSLTNSFPQTYKTNSHQLLLGWQKKGFYILLLQLHCELQVNGKYSATQWWKNTRAQDSLMSKARSQAGRGDDIRSSLVKDLHCIGLKFGYSDFRRFRKQLSGCKDRIEVGASYSNDDWLLHGNNTGFRFKSPRCWVRGMAVQLIFPVLSYQVVCISAKPGPCLLVVVCWLWMS